MTHEEQQAWEEKVAAEGRPAPAPPVCNTPDCERPQIGINGFCAPCQDRYLDFT